MGLFCVDDDHGIWVGLLFWFGGIDGEDEGGASGGLCCTSVVVPLPLLPLIVFQDLNRCYHSIAPDIYDKSYDLKSAILPWTRYREYNNDTEATRTL